MSFLVGFVGAMIMFHGVDQIDKHFQIGAVEMSIGAALIIAALIAHVVLGGDE